MALRWVLFDLNLTLVDPSVLAQPLGDSADTEELVVRAFDTAVAEAMAMTLTGGHADFRELVDAALRRELSVTGRDPALAADSLDLLGSMPAFIEAPGALERLRSEGLHLGVISQSSTSAADQVLRFAGLRDRMDLVIGANEVGVFKPHPRVYEFAIERTGVPTSEICFVAAHWWDIMGAARAGLRTGWVGRRERALLATVPEPNVRGNDLTEVSERIVAEML